MVGFGDERASGVAVNWHPTEEDLVLHYFGESPSEERARVDDHLHVCPACTAIWQELTDTLGAVRAVQVPEPPPEFERVMWARISRELPRRPAQWIPRQFVLAGTLAAVLVAMVAIGYGWITRQREQAAAATASAESAPTTPATSGHARERVLLTALNDHFTQTEVLFTELLNSPPADGTELAFERTTADDLVASGRLYRQTARQNGDVQFAQLLDEVEGVLVEVARSPERVDRQDFESLRARIDDDGLLFKVRAVTAEVRDRQHTLMTLQ